MGKINDRNLIENTPSLSNITISSLKYCYVTQRKDVQGDKNILQLIQYLTMVYLKKIDTKMSTYNHYTVK